MKIEILCPGNPSMSANVYADNKKVSAPKRSITDTFGWSEDELMLLLGESKFTKYENGDYIFTISDSHFKLVTGRRAKKSYDVTVVLCEKDGQEVINTADF